jgi:uncharacterized protein (TIGR02246 family)
MNSDKTKQETIRGIVESQMNAWCSGDADGYAANAGEDLSFTNIRGQHWTGRTAFVKVHDSVLRGVYAGSRLECDVERLSFPGTAVAVAEMITRLSGARGMPARIAPDADGVLRTRLLEVFELRDGIWTLIICHNTVVIA